MTLAVWSARVCGWLQGRGLGGVLGGGDGDGQAEGLELADVAADLALGADPLVVVAGAEISEPGGGVGGCRPGRGLRAEVLTVI